MISQMILRLISFATGRVAAWHRPRWIAKALIRGFAKLYKIETAEAELPLQEYRSLDHFFTRRLKPGSRSVGAGVVSPADGKLYSIGHVDPSGGSATILQVKGAYYTVSQLLAAEAGECARFAAGVYATIYLAPHNYHRVHAPFAGRLVRAIHVPGRLFSVAPWTTESIPRLFARNERLALIFDTERGPLAVVLVGAIFVSSIETVFDGEVTPPYADQVRVRDYSGTNAPRFDIGAELGRFNMGSTAIVLTAAGFGDWAPGLAEGTRVRMGQSMQAAG